MPRFVAVPDVDVAELLRLRRVPLQPTIATNRRSGLANFVQHGFVRNSSPKPYFVCTETKISTLDEALSDSRWGDEFSSEGRILDCTLDVDEDVEHFKRSLDYEPQGSFRCIAIGEVSALYAPEREVKCLTVYKAPIIDEDNNSVRMRTADPLYARRPSLETVCASAVPDNALWLIEMPERLQASGDTGSNQCVAPIDTASDQPPKPFDKQGPSRSLTAKESKTIRQLRWVALLFHSVMLLPSAALLVAVWYFFGRMEGGDWPWYATACAFLLGLLALTLLIGPLWMWLCYVGQHLSAKYGVERRIARRRSGKRPWKATTSKCLEDGARIRGAITLDEWTSMRRNHRMCTKAAEGR